MSLSIKILPETVRTLAFGSVGAAYAGIGTAMTKPVRIFLIQNLTDAGVMVSFDGIDDHFPMPALGFLLLDVTANKTIHQGFFFAEGQRVYVKRLVGAPTSGSVYLTTFYGSD